MRLLIVSADLLQDPVDAFLDLWLVLQASLARAQEGEDSSTADVVDPTGEHQPQIGGDGDDVFAGRGAEEMRDGL